MLGLLIALEVVLSRFLSVATGSVKIGVQFMPIAIAAMLYGPLWGGAVGALADLVGALAFPIGAYFPGFTISAFLAGMIYGLFLYNRKVTKYNAMIAAALISVVVRMLLDSFWLYQFFMGNAILAYMPVRILVNTILIFVQTGFILLFANRLGKGVIAQIQNERLAALRMRARRYFTKDPDLRAAVSAGITAQCLSLPAYRDAKTVFCFVGTEKEVDTSAILQQALDDGKSLCVPLCEGPGKMSARKIRSLEELRTVGAFGILEPTKDAPVVEKQQIDFAIVPCSGANRRHDRVGKGGHYYDNYLQDTEMVKAVLCPKALVVRDLPVKPYDVPVDFVITEMQIF